MRGPRVELTSLAGAQVVDQLGRRLGRLLSMNSQLTIITGA